MTFVQAIQSAFKNYAKFNGRATRSEYWWFFLFQVIILIVPDIMMNAEIRNGGAGIGTMLYVVLALATFLPGLGLSFRRLHDTDRSAWWLLIAFVPLVGGILLIVWCATKGTLGPNKYGVGDTVAQVVNTF